MFKKKYIYFLTLLVLPISIVLNYVFDPNILYTLWLENLILATSIMLSSLSCLFYFKKKTFLYRFLLFSNIVLCIIIAAYSFFSKYDLLFVFSSISTFKEFILSTKQMGMFIYVLIQIAQIMFLPIPSMIITLAGVAIYGPLLGSFLCSIGVLLGSFFAFGIGKLFGIRIVSWMAGKDNATKYADIINKRGKFFLIIAFLLPLFPDDILCLIAGITSMKFKEFCIIATITRPIGVICMSYFGGGYIIPFSGWGLFVWPVILIVAIVAVILLTKYQPQIEKYIVDKLYKLNFKRKKKKELK